MIKCQCYDDSEVSKKLITALYKNLCLAIPEIAIIHINYMIIKLIFIYTQHYDNKWCNQDLYGKDHTMCSFEDGAQSSCGTVISRGITTKVSIHLPT